MLPKSESDTAFRSLSAFGDFLRDGNNRAEHILPGLERLNLPAAYFNLAAVLAADALRRRDKVDLARKVIARSSNDCLKFLFERWLERKLGETARSFEFDPSRSNETN
jgi:hypothetical protein